MFNTVIADELKQYRKQNRISQTKAAELIGFSQAYYCIIEKGEHDLGIAQLFRIASCLDETGELFYNVLEKIKQFANENLIMGI